MQLLLESRSQESRMMGEQENHLKQGSLCVFSCDGLAQDAKCHFVERLIAAMGGHPLQLGLWLP